MFFVGVEICETEEGDLFEQELGFNITNIRKFFPYRENGDNTLVILDDWDEHEVVMPFDDFTQELDRIKRDNVFARYLKDKGN